MTGKKVLALTILITFISVGVTAPLWEHGAAVALTGLAIVIVAIVAVAWAVHTLVQ